LPSQVKKEKNKDIEGILLVLSTYNKIQNKKMEQSTKKKIRK